jgi:hypothetical protein
MNLGAADVAAAMKGQSNTSPVDPMQWWGAISQQFQSIAAKTMQDMQEHSATAAKASPSKPAKPAAKSAAKSAAKARTGTRARAAKTKP